MIQIEYNDNRQTYSLWLYPEEFVPNVIFCIKRGWSVKVTDARPPLEMER